MRFGAGQETVGWGMGRLKDSEACMKKHLEIWSETDRQKRKQAIDELYAETCEVFDPNYADVFRGHDALMGLIDEVQSKFPGFVFTKRQQDEHHNIVKLTWSLGPLDQPDAITGEDVFIMN